MIRTLFPAIVATALLGCGRDFRDETPAQPATSAYPLPAATLATGVVTGRVTWTGAVPSVPPINGLVRNREGSRWDNVPNHLAPKIDPTTKTVADAVVWLSGVDGTKAKAWPYPPLTVEVRDFRIQAKQGTTTGRIGFTRVGDEVTLTSADTEFQSLRARGAEFFTVALPMPAVPLKRRLDRPGHVEFTSGAGYFWSAADVFVCEHPYVAATDAVGQFRFDHVPPGEYEAVAWLRNWTVLGADRDPETGRTMRLTFAEPFTVRATVGVADRKMSDVTLSFPSGPVRK